MLPEFSFLMNLHQQAQVMADDQERQDEPVGLKDKEVVSKKDFQPDQHTWTSMGVSWASWAISAGTTDYDTRQIKSFDDVGQPLADTLQAFATEANRFSSAKIDVVTSEKMLPREICAASQQILDSDWCRVQQISWELENLFTELQKLDKHGKERDEQLMTQANELRRAVEEKIQNHLDLCSDKKQLRKSFRELRQLHLGKGSSTDNEGEYRNPANWRVCSYMLDSLDRFSKEVVLLPYDTIRNCQLNDDDWWSVYSFSESLCRLLTSLNQIDLLDEEEADLTAEIMDYSWRKLLPPLQRELEKTEDKAHYREVLRVIKDECQKYIAKHPSETCTHIHQKVLHELTQLSIEPIPLPTVPEAADDMRGRLNCSGGIVEAACKMFDQGLRGEPLRTYAEEAARLYMKCLTESSATYDEWSSIVDIANADAEELKQRNNQLPRDHKSLDPLLNCIKALPNIVREKPVEAVPEPTPLDTFPEQLNSLMSASIDPDSPPSSLGSLSHQIDLKLQEELLHIPDDQQDSALNSLSSTLLSQVPSQPPEARKVTGQALQSIKKAKKSKKLPKPAPKPSTSKASVKNSQQKHTDITDELAKMIANDYKKGRQGKRWQLHWHDKLHSQIAHLPDHNHASEARKIVRGVVRSLQNTHKQTQALGEIETIKEILLAPYPEKQTKKRPIAIPKVEEVTRPYEPPVVHEEPTPPHELLALKLIQIHGNKRISEDEKRRRLTETVTEALADFSSEEKEAIRRQTWVQLSQKLSGEEHQQTWNSIKPLLEPPQKQHVEPVRTQTLPLPEVRPLEEPDTPNIRTTPTPPPVEIVPSQSMETIPTQSVEMAPVPSLETTAQSIERTTTQSTEVTPPFQPEAVVEPVGLNLQDHIGFIEDLHRQIRRDLINHPGDLQKAESWSMYILQHKGVYPEHLQEEIVSTVSAMILGNLQDDLKDHPELEQYLEEVEAALKLQDLSRFKPAAVAPPTFDKQKHWVFMETLQEHVRRDLFFHADDPIKQLAWRNELCEYLRNQPAQLHDAIVTAAYQHIEEQLQRDIPEYAFIPDYLPIIRRALESHRHQNFAPTAVPAACVRDIPPPPTRPQVLPQQAMATPVVPTPQPDFVRTEPLHGEAPWPAIHGPRFISQLEILRIMPADFYVGMDEEGNLNYEAELTPAFQVQVERLQASMESYLLNCIFPAVSEFIPEYELIQFLLPANPNDCRVGELKRVVDELFSHERTAALFNTPPPSNQVKQRFADCENKAMVVGCGAGHEGHRHVHPARTSFTADINQDVLPDLVGDISDTIHMLPHKENFGVIFFECISGDVFSSPLKIKSTLKKCHELLKPEGMLILLTGSVKWSHPNVGDIRDQIVECYSNAGFKNIKYTADEEVQQAFRAFNHNGNMQDQSAAIMANVVPVDQIPANFIEMMNMGICIVATKDGLWQTPGAGQ